jgi:hypothetical protein
LTKSRWRGAEELQSYGPTHLAEADHHQGSGAELGRDRQWHVRMSSRAPFSYELKRRISTSTIPARDSPGCILAKARRVIDFSEDGNSFTRIDRERIVWKSAAAS